MPIDMHIIWYVGLFLLHISQEDKKTGLKMPKKPKNLPPFTQQTIIAALWKKQNSTASTQ